MEYLASAFWIKGISPVSCSGPEWSWWFNVIYIVLKNEQWQMSPLQVPRAVSLGRILLWQHCICHCSDKLGVLHLSSSQKEDYLPQSIQQKTRNCKCLSCAGTQTCIQLLKETQMGKWPTPQDCTSPVEAKMSCVFWVLHSLCMAI